MVPIIRTAASKQKADISPNHSHILWKKIWINIASNTKCHDIFTMTKSRQLAHKSYQYIATHKRALHIVAFLNSEVTEHGKEEAARTCFSSSFSSGVAVTLCGMEEQCVCTTAGCDFSRWPFWSAGRQQQSHDTALARRTDCLTA